MADERSTPTKKSWSSHPLANVLIGFLLTGVVGTLITQYFFDRREQAQLRTKHMEDRQKTIESLSKRPVEMLTRAELFVEALTPTPSSPEKTIRTRKEQYDEAYLKWKTDSPVTLLVAKDLLTPSDYRNFRRDVETKLHDNMLYPANACVQQAYANLAHVEQARQILTDCRIETLLQQANACVNALTEQLHELTIHGADLGQETAARRTKLSQSADEHCSSETTR